MSKNVDKSLMIRRHDLWNAINKNYKLVEAPDITIFLSLIKPYLTYQYLEDFITFAKIIDKNMCMTAFSKVDWIWAAEKDIQRCLLKYAGDKASQHPILYVDFIFDEKANAFFNDVYLMFLVKDEQSLLDMLFKFNKLKVFS